LAIAIKASAARDVMEADDAISNRPLLDARAFLNDSTGDFMPQDLRGRDQPVTHLLHIGSADSACRNLQQDFVILDVRDRNIFHDDTA
jgi:hypothetical protein